MTCERCPTLTFGHKICGAPGKIKTRGSCPKAAIQASHSKMSDNIQGLLEGGTCALGPDLRWPRKADNLWVPVSPYFLSELIRVETLPCRAEPVQGTETSRVGAAGAARSSWPGALCLRPSSCRRALESRVFSSSIFISSNLEPREASARVLKGLSQENGAHRPIGNV